MIMVKSLIWDEWNKNHIAEHKISIEEIEEVCHGYHHVKESYRKRLLIIGETEAKRLIVIVLSPENRNLEPYGKGIYYVVTAFEKEVIV